MITKKIEEEIKKKLEEIPQDYRKKIRELSSLAIKIVSESEELEVKTNKLLSFIKSEKFNEINIIHKDLLKLQYTTMLSYQKILDARFKVVYADFDNILGSSDCDLTSIYEMILSLYGKILKIRTDHLKSYNVSEEE